jgi:CHAD domain-containing protein
MLLPQRRRDRIPNGFVFAVFPFVERRRYSSLMKSTESIGDRLQQFALSQIDRAITYLTDAKHDPDEAIHETRRCLKRVRATLRLVKSELAITTYDRDNLYLRNVGRQLAALRDAAVMVETLAALQKEFSAQLSEEAWRDLSTELANLQRKKKLPVTLTARLHAARARVGKWDLKFDDEAVVSKGLRKAYQRGIRAMQQAFQEPTAENFHEWRKQVNHLRHQLQILQNLKLGKVKKILPEFKSLAEILGRKNDLAVLSHHDQRIKHKAGAPARQALETLIQARDAALAAEAIRLGQQLYARKPKAFIHQLNL